MLKNFDFLGIFFARNKFVSTIGFLFCFASWIFFELYYFIWFQQIIKDGPQNRKIDKAFGKIFQMLFRKAKKQSWPIATFKKHFQCPNPSRKTFKVSVSRAFHSSYSRTELSRIFRTLSLKFLRNGNHMRN